MDIQTIFNTLTTQGPFAIIVFILLFRLEQRLDRMTEAIAKVGESVTLLAARLESRRK